MKNENLVHLLLTLFRFLGARRQRQLVLLTLLMFVSAFSEVISLGLVIPFLGLLISPDKLMSFPLASKLAHFWGFSSGKEILLPITILFVVVSIFAGAIRMFQLWASTKLTFAAGADLSYEIYRRTLYQPYHAHLQRNTSVVVSSVIDKVNNVVFWILLPLMTLLSSLLLLVFITVTLLIISPLVACVSILSFGSAYVLITQITKKKLRSNGECIAREQTQVVKAVQEGLGGIRDVLLDGTQEIYCEIYRKADQPLRNANGSNSFLSGCPRFAIEAFGIAMITILAYSLSQQPEGISAALPTLGALALGAQRLLPALQQSYYAWSSINGSRASLIEVLDMLKYELSQEQTQDASKILKMPFTHSIEFSSVSFRYSDQLPLVLENINFKIPKGSRVGFVGTTGSGKSTTLDLLMGLLAPTSGQIKIDGQNINQQNLRSWQKNIAHVPQSIYLSDATIAENIAFGIPKEKIDIERVKIAAQKAQISDYIEGRAEGYEALVGERGVMLSGGQRQRIGIARALYKNASVIIFDEATSALDSETEQNVMSSIEKMSRDLTILIIAHRTSTLKLCDMTVTLKGAKAHLENAL